MDRFQDLLKQAAQIKDAQLKNQRKTFEGLPDYLKAGLNYNRKYKTLRKQHFLVQLHVSINLKTSGNQQYMLQNYSQALSSYQQSLAIFRYVNASTYQNMKDDDMEYMMFRPQEKYQQELNNHFHALYLNICSCLTKMNKKEDALHSVNEGMKIKETAKGNYKKAQVYLQYINKDCNDVKLGLLYLHRAYELSKDGAILQLMYSVKQEIEEEKRKQKEMFKFMVDGKGVRKEQRQAEEKEVKKEERKLEGFKKQTKQVKNELNEYVVEATEAQKRGQRVQQADTLQQLPNLLPSMNNCPTQPIYQKQQQTQPKQQLRFQKTKQRLNKYTSLQLSQQQWQYYYDYDFIHSHGSKIYSLLQFYGYKQLVGEYRAILGQCLQLSRQQVGIQREPIDKYLRWLKEHPIERIRKYIERYELQRKWINEQRKKQEHIQAQNKTIKAQTNMKQTQIAEGSSTSTSNVIQQSKTSELIWSNKYTMIAVLLMLAITLMLANDIIL